MKIKVDNKVFESKFGILQTQITGRCNMRCQHCRAWKSSQSDLPLKTFKEVLKFAVSEKAKVFHVTLSGGEPFLHPQLMDFIDAVEQANPESLSITTNGSIVRRDILERLRNSKVKCHVQISLDSPNAKEHNTFRGFEDAWQKATHLMEILNEKKIPFAIRMTVTPNTFMKMDEMVELAKRLGAVRLSLDPVIPAGKGVNEMLWLSPKQKVLFLEKVIELKKENEGKFEILSECPQKLVLPNSPYLVDKVDLTSPALFGGCTAGVTQISLENDGKITPCALLPLTIIDATGKNMKELKDAYENSSIVKELFARKFNGTCGSCKFNRLCGGCRANAFFNGDYLGSDLSCILGGEFE